MVDTLEKFQEQILDPSTQYAKDFVIFKRQLYLMYEVQNRSVEEHELYSFKIERENLTLLSNANEDY